MLPAFLPSAPSLEALGQIEWQEAQRRARLRDGAILEAVLESSPGLRRSLCQCREGPNLRESQVRIPSSTERDTVIKLSMPTSRNAKYSLIPFPPKDICSGYSVRGVVESLKVCDLLREDFGDAEQMAGVQTLDLSPGRCEIGTHGPSRFPVSSPGGET